MNDVEECKEELTQRNTYGMTDYACCGGRAKQFEAFIRWKKDDQACCACTCMHVTWKISDRHVLTINRFVFLRSSLGGPAGPTSHPVS